MTNQLDILSPQKLWQYFDKIRLIPHGSKNEKALSEAILLWAKEAGCSGKQDALGNIAVSIPASSGFETAPTTVLQSHMDMVCEKDKDFDFDFLKNAVEIVREGDWITANHTTLGADNGIGLAASLALMEDKNFVHGPIEILVTVEEETGLTGAKALTSDFVDGRILLNLDSEDDGVFCVGCAGGLDSITTLTVQRIPVENSRTSFEIRVSGLRGGHSGVDIVQNRANAIVLAARLLWELQKETNTELSWFIGGDKHNAIPREALASIVVPDEQCSSVIDIVSRMESAFQKEYGSYEPGLRVTALSSENLPSTVLTKDSFRAITAGCLIFPNGVMSLIRDMPNVVETSNNLARVRCNENEFTFLNSSRSSVREAVLAAATKIEACAAVLGADFEKLSEYPGWKPNMESPILHRACKVWEQTHKTKPKIEVIHAGLECGILGDNIPGMDMISFGPTIEAPHSPSERVSISSVEKFYTFLKALLSDIADSK